MGFRIAVITTDPLAARMPGPAIRAWHLAEALADEHDVVLASTVACERTHPRFRTEFVEGQGLRDLEAWLDVLVVPPGLLPGHRFLAESGKVVVVDIYDPFHLENLEGSLSLDGPEADALIAHLTSVLDEGLVRGDFFLCANERQRDFWLGSLAALGRVNPYTYRQDPNLRALIEVVPFGLPSEPPVQRAHALRGVVPGIGLDDKVILWAGGVYDWFDPCSLVSAVDLVRREQPSVRLYFLGMQHPNPAIPEMRVAGEVRRLSEKLGLIGTHVFFNDEWVDYERRVDYLLDADIGVSTHPDHIETAFSFRTRVLDYLWAGLPMVLTDGDDFAKLVRAQNLGATAKPGDPGSIAQAILAVLDAPPERAAVRAAGERFAWDRVSAPLLDFCRSPRRAPDLIARDRPKEIPPPAGNFSRRVLESWRHEGTTATLRRANRWLHTRLS